MSNFREELKKPLRKMLMNFAPQHIVDIFLETYAEEYFDQIIELVKGEIKVARVNMPSNPYQQYELDDAYRTGQEELTKMQLAKLEEGKQR